MGVLSMKAKNKRRNVAALLVSGVLLLSVGTAAIAAHNHNKGTSGKRAFQNAVNRATSLGDASPAPTPSDPGPLGPPYSQEPPLLGDVYQSPDYPGGGYTFTTGWEGTIGNLNITIYAGSLAGDSTQGVLVVHDENRTTYSVDVASFPTPANDGALTISDVSNGMVNLQADDGSALAFDLSSNQFVSSDSPTPSGSGSSPGA